MNKVIHMKDELLYIVDTFWPYSVTPLFLTTGLF